MPSDIILGIDLGTTNSEVAIIRDGQPVVLTDEDGDPILPSVVGLDVEGRLLVGKPARNQAALAPERTVRSIKRSMGQEMTVNLGEKTYSPQEISAIILRTLKQRAEREIGEAVTRAVITVPAYFSEQQRQATRQAGELAGLEVLRIINEPTAAILTYDPNPPEQQRLLVYDLGGGTFDVSIARVESGVVEILASQGDNNLGGDDFDQRLLDYVCEQFQDQHGIDLQDNLAARARLLRAVEDAKKLLSNEGEAAVQEEFLVEKDGVPINLDMTLARDTYENLIEPLIDRTLRCVDQALTDSGLQAREIDKVVLVGGATRTPLIQNLLAQRMSRPVHTEIEPDLAVAMGAAVQGGLIAGVDVGAVLVDITPRTLGIQIVGEVGDGSGFSQYAFSPIINRNTPLPAVRTELYHTIYDEQEAVDINVYQGESGDVRNNDLVGEFTIEGLAKVKAGNVIVVKLELDLDGILKVTATERSTGLAKAVTIDNAAERFKIQQRSDAADRIEQIFVDAVGEAAATESPGDVRDVTPEPETIDPALRELQQKAETILAKIEALGDKATDEDATELGELKDKLQKAIDSADTEQVNQILGEIDNILFYIEDR